MSFESCHFAGVRFSNLKRIEIKKASVWKPSYNESREELILYAYLLVGGRSEDKQQNYRVVVE